MPLAAATTSNLGTIGGENGYRIDGESAGDEAGKAVSTAGDINGDGLDDFIIGSATADPGGVQNAGSIYVVFGRIDKLQQLSLSDLNGVNGFKITGATWGDLAGAAVSNAGDVNGDGLGDLLIGAPGAASNDLTSSGAAFIVFGSSLFPPSIDLSSLNGVTGFRINGVDEGDRAGTSVSSAGDVNGDGLDDVIIGAPNARVGSKLEAGSGYVVFGSKINKPSIDLINLNGTDGFRIRGNQEGAFSGNAVAGAGDLNRDGYDDVAISAWMWGDGSPDETGAVFVIYGNSEFSAILGLGSLKGTNGFRIEGIEAGDGTGKSVSIAGDVNRDGYADLVIGAPFALNRAGASYILFGGKSLPAVVKLSTLNGQNGVAIHGAAGVGQNGLSVSSSDDVNADGYSDVLVGAPGEGEGSNRFAGRAYVLLGKKEYTSPIKLDESSAAAKLTYEGAAGGHQAGQAVSSAGDTNGDGFDDFLVSAPRGGDSDTKSAGYTYLILGGGTLDLSLPVTHPGTPTDDNMIGSADSDIMNGARGDDTIEGMANNDILTGAAGDDTVIGGPGADFLAGKNGKDTASYATSNAAVTIDLWRGSAQGGDAEGDILTHIENLTGSPAADNLTGNHRGNVLQGLGGDDTLMGRHGNDTFKFGPGSGHDTILDFTAGPGTDDLLDLRDYDDVIEISDLFIEQIGSDTRVTLPGGESILLKSVGASSLHPDDFWIGNAPLAMNDSFDTPIGARLEISEPGVLANDENPAAQPMTAVLVDKPVHGQLTLNSNGSFIYEPGTEFIGTDQFTYLADNGQKSNKSTVTITVTLIPPTAQNDSYKTTTDETLEIPSPGVLANDMSPGGLLLTAILTLEPLHGTLTFNADGSFVYEPETDDPVIDTFKYRASNGLSSEEAEVTIDVRSPGSGNSYQLFLPSIHGAG